MNNKLKLYENIMSKLATVVKTSLNEKNYYGESVAYIAVEFTGDWHLYNYKNAQEVIDYYGLDTVDIDNVNSLNAWESYHIVYEGDDVVIIKVE